MSMIELLVTIMLAAILFAVGIPSYKYVTNSNRVSGEINALLGDMTLARSEAIRQGQTVSICPAANTTGTACATSTSASWTAGWIVFTDFNGNGTIDSGAPQNDTVLRFQPAFTSTDTMALTNLANNFMSFNREGFAANLSGLSDQNHVLFRLQTSPVNNQWTRCLDIWLSGQMTTERYGQSQVANGITGTTTC